MADSAAYRGQTLHRIQCKLTGGQILQQLHGNRPKAGSGKVANTTIRVNCKPVELPTLNLIIFWSHEDIQPIIDVSRHKENLKEAHESSSHTQAMPFTALSFLPARVYLFDSRSCHRRDALRLVNGKQLRQHGERACRHLVQETGDAEPNLCLGMSRKFIP